MSLAAPVELETENETDVMIDAPAVVHNNGDATVGVGVSVGVSDHMHDDEAVVGTGNVVGTSDLMHVGAVDNADEVAEFDVDAFLAMIEIWHCSC